MTEDKARPDKSISKGVGPANHRNFSSFDDLADWAVRRGLASSVGDVRTNRRDLWGDLLFTWYTQGQVACVYAQHLARTPDESGWYSAVLDGDLNADLVTEIVDVAAGAGAEAIQLLFPGNADVEQALLIVRTLTSHARWICAERTWLDGEAGDSIQIGLQWISPARGYESWALGIAPFEPTPFTRRFVGAPFLALVLRPTPPVPGRADVIGDSGLPAAHLAHMEDLLEGDEEKRDKFTEGTRKAKRALISPDPMSRARAKVTFSFPAWARSELGGCA